MLSFSRPTRLLPALAAGLLLAGLLGSCAGESQKTGPGESLSPLPALSWPPQAQALRSISDDTIYIDGRDCAEKGGSTQVQQTQLILKSGNSINYAIYAVDGFDPTVSLSDLSVEFNQISGTTGDGTALYIGFANYNASHWEWNTGDPPSESFSFGAEFSDYTSPGGGFYVACVQTGPGNIAITRLSFARTGAGAFVPAPQNLVISPMFGSMDLSWDPVSFVQGYDVYRDDDAAFDNPVKLNATPIAAAAFSDSTVTPLTHYWYAVKALRGLDSNYLESAFSEVADAVSLPPTVPAPTNLTGSGDVGVAHLSWDAVIGATSYILYRSTSYSFANPTQIQAVITNPNYDDSGLAWDKSYFYKVVAKSGVLVSDYSNQADVFVPAADLPAPTNLHVVASHGDFVSIAWDYVDSGQDGFRVYYSYFPDFDMTGPFYKVNTISNPIVRSDDLFGLPSGQTFYVRVCAYNNVGRGRATDDISFMSESYWSWETPVDLGAGTGPITLLSGNGTTEKESVAYFQSGSVKFRQMTNVTWSAAESVGLDTNYDEYLDMAYSGSDYIIGTYDKLPQDAWISIGNPGSWSAARIDGDGSTALGHNQSGFCIKVAADANQYSVTHVFYYDEANTKYDLRLQQHPHSGGSWSNVEINNDVLPVIYQSMAYDSGNLIMLLEDVIVHQLYYGDQSGGFNWTDIANSGTDNLGLYNDIKPYNGEWMTPAYNGTSKELYVMQGSGTNWSKTLLTGGLNNLNRMQLAVLDDGDPTPPAAMIIFYSSANSRWFYAYFDGTSWSSSSIIIPGITFGVNMDIAKLTFPGGSAYPLIVFDDSNGNLWSSYGVPPS